jgi:ketosteroid isomerase-like protein
VSRENEELVQESYRAFAASNLDRMAELYHEDAIVVEPEGWPETGRFVGKEAVMRNYAQIQEDWDSQEITVESTESRGDIVITKHIWHAQGKGSGVTTQLNLTGVHRIRDGKIAEARFYRDHERALRAWGLRE